MKWNLLALPTILTLSALGLNASTVLTFEGLLDEEAIQNFYNGGTGSFGSSGPNYGISFSGNSLSVIDFSAGGSGDTQLEPSGVTTAIFLDGTSDIMDVAGGFTTSLSVFYSAPFVAGSITIYDGLDATGNVLATITLPTTVDGIGVISCGGFDFCPYTQVSTLFSGTARSVDFGGALDQISFDDITLGNLGAEAPEPSTFFLIGAGAVGAGFLRKKKKS